MCSVQFTTFFNAKMQFAYFLFLWHYTNVFGEFSFQSFPLIFIPCFRACSHKLDVKIVWFSSVKDTNKMLVQL